MPTRIEIVRFALVGTSIAVISTFGAHTAGVVKPFVRGDLGITYLALCAVAALLYVRGRSTHTFLGACCSLATVFPALFMLASLGINMGGEGLESVSISIRAEFCGSAGNLSIFSIAIGFGVSGVAGAAWSISLSKVFNRLWKSTVPLGSQKPYGWHFTKRICGHLYWLFVAFCLANFFLALFWREDILTKVCHSLFVS